MSLSSTVSLVLDHLSTFLGADHGHLEALSFDFGFVSLAGLFLGGQDGLFSLFLIL